MYRQIGRVWWVVMVVLLAVGCGGEEAAPERGSISNTPRYDGPEPAAGLGNVYGRILWNEVGAAGLDVVMCQDFSSFSGCGGPEIRAVTDNDGYYLFTDMDPGAYALSVRVFNTDNWLYVSSGILSSADFIIEADETLVVETQNIFKLDIAPTYPANGDKVKAGAQTLTWAAYPDAAYYLLYLAPDSGDALLVNQRVESTEVAVGLLPVNCDYRWSIEAFNANGVKVAETAEFFTFAVAGEESSCRLNLIAPVDAAEVDGGSVVLDWEPHPLAASYKILMWNDTDPDRPNILNFVGVAEALYRFDQPLAPARYVWSVSAYDADNIKIAESEIFDFTVKP